MNEFYFSHITTKLASSTSWRRGLILKFPIDAKRNIHAAELLYGLASAKRYDVAPNAWDRITPHLESEYFTEALNLANRSVGFRHRPADFNDYLAIVSEFAEGLALPVLGGAK